MKYSFQKKDVLILFIIVYAISFGLFYPSFITTLDENNFLRAAFLLTNGGILIDDPSYQLGFGHNGFSGYVPYFIGQSILLVIFISFGWEGAFLLGMVLHMIGSLIFYKIVVEENKRSVLYLALFIFFPYFIFYSTTLFSDYSSAVFIFSAFYFYIKDKKKTNVLSGLLFGFSFVIKYTNVLVFVPFILYTIVKNRNKMIHLLIGIAPFVILILVFNTIYFGGPLKTLHDSAGYIGVGPSVVSFSLLNYTSYLLFIIFRLIIIYPLMFFAPFLYRGKGWKEILGVYVLFLIFFGARFQSGFGFGFEPSTLTRYMIPILPFIILTYTDFVHKISKIIKNVNSIKKILSILIIICLIGSSIMILQFQNNYLSVQRSVQENIYSNTKEKSLIISEQDVMKYIMGAFGDRRFLDTERYSNFSDFIDDNTFIVHKSIPEEYLDEKLLNRSKLTKNIIKNTDNELVFNQSYPSLPGLIKTKPFNLEIYKVYNQN